MKNNHKTKEDEIWEGLYPRMLFLIKTNKWAWQSVGAGFGVGGGILSIIAAIVLPVIASRLVPNDTVFFLKGVSSVLLILCLPLLALGAHCLDLLEKKPVDFPAAELKSGSIKSYFKSQDIKDTLNHNLVFIWTAVALTLFLPFGAQAQQAVFNVPTADVLDKGKVYVELDASFKANNQEALRRFSSFVPRIVVGAGGNVEVGLNVIGNLNPGTDTTTLVPTAKWKFFQNGKRDLAFFAGNNLYIPVRNKSYNIGTYTYVAAAKTINQKTRLTTGAFVYSKNVVAPNASRGGGQFAIEQTINRKVTLAADWMTGKHANGYFTPGVIYKPHARVTTYFSYSLGNARLTQGNHYFLFEIGYNLN